MRRMVVLFSLVSLLVLAGVSVARADEWHWSENVVHDVPGDNVRSAASSWALHPWPEAFLSAMECSYKDYVYQGCDYASGTNQWHVFGTVYMYDPDPPDNNYFQGYGSHYYSDFGSAYSYGELYN